MTRSTLSEPTSEELAAALSDPDALYEIVDGAIVEKPEMSFLAAMIAMRLWAALNEFAKVQRIGVAVHETVFVLDPSRPLKRRPDAAFVSFDRWPEDQEIPEEGDWEVVPDLAIEVLSPRDVDRDVNRKLREYFRYGVRQVWHVRPSTGEVYVYDSPKQITVYDGDDILDGGALLPGFRLTLADLFRRTVGR